MNAPPLHSCSNGQVERFHGTLADIARSFKLEKMSDDTAELILRATIAYNRSIHSVTSQTPIDAIQPNMITLKDLTRTGKIEFLKLAKKCSKKTIKGRVLTYEKIAQAKVNS